MIVERALRTLTGRAARRVPACNSLWLIVTTSAARKASTISLGQRRWLVFSPLDAKLTSNISSLVNGRSTI